jgi:hypothetical protein
VHFERGGYRSKVFGPFEHLSSLNGVVYGDRIVIGFFDAQRIRRRLPLFHAMAGLITGRCSAVCSVGKAFEQLPAFGPSASNHFTFAARRVPDDLKDLV